MIWIALYLVFGLVYAGLDVLDNYTNQGKAAAVLATLFMSPFWPVFLVRRISQ